MFRGDGRLEVDKETDRVLECKLSAFGMQKEGKALRVNRLAATGRLKYGRDQLLVVRDLALPGLESESGRVTSSLEPVVSRGDGAPATARHCTAGTYRRQLSGE